MMSNAPIDALVRAVAVLQQQGHTLCDVNETDSYGQPTNPYQRAALFQIREDAASIRKLAQSLCEHPDGDYEPPTTDGEGMLWAAKCSACGRTWPLGSNRDDEKMGVAQR